MSDAKTANEAWMSGLLDAVSRGSGAWYLPLLAFFRDLPERGAALAEAADEEDRALENLRLANERLREVRERSAGLVSGWSKAEVMRCASEHHGWSWLKVPAEHAEAALRDAEMRETDEDLKQDRRRRGRRS